VKGVFHMWSSGYFIILVVFLPPRFLLFCSKDDDHKHNVNQHVNCVHEILVYKSVETLMYKVRTATLDRSPTAKKKQVSELHHFFPSLCSVHDQFARFPIFVSAVRKVSSDYEGNFALPQLLHGNKNRIRCPVLNVYKYRRTSAD
jgi:hypothetical protein